MNVPADPKGVQQTSWGATVGTTIALQWAVVLVLSAAAWVWKGEAGALSLLGGGGAVALPNALLALWLTLRVRRYGVLNPAMMLLGEILKLGLTMALLVTVIAELKPVMIWPLMIVGVIAALKAQWLALWFTRKL